MRATRKRVTGSCWLRCKGHVRFHKCSYHIGSADANMQIPLKHFSYTNTRRSITTSFICFLGNPIISLMTLISWLPSHARGFCTFRRSFPYRRKYDSNWQEESVPNLNGPRKHDCRTFFGVCSPPSLLENDLTSFLGIFCSDYASGEVRVRHFIIVQREGRDTYPDAYPLLY